AIVRRPGSRRFPEGPRQARRRVRAHPRHGPGPVDRGVVGRGIDVRGGARGRHRRPSGRARGEGGAGRPRVTVPLRRSGGPFAVADRLPAISDRAFALFQALIQREAGIYLAPAKKALLVGRLAKRLRALGLSSFEEDYRRIVDEEDLDERTEMLDCTSTNEPHFFGEPRQFEFLERQVIPAWKQRGLRTLRIWSAGCSTGEEAFSLAMLLRHHFPPGGGRQIEILGTDISTRVLARAEAAIFPIDRADEIPISYRRAFMLRGTGPQEGRMKAAPEIREMVRFE